MTTPDTETFAAILALQGLEMSDDRIAAAVEHHIGILPGLEGLRTSSLSFLEPVSEPGSALAWIESGGTQ